MQKRTILFVFLFISLTLAMIYINQKDDIKYEMNFFHSSVSMPSMFEHPRTFEIHYDKEKDQTFIFINKVADVNIQSVKDKDGVIFIQLKEIKSDNHFSEGTIKINGKYTDASMKVKYLNGETFHLKRFYREK